MSYNVVFEHTDPTNLFFGTRTWTDYRSPEYFAKNYKPTNLEKILEEGASQEQALNLTSLTPEICRIAAAIEEVFQYSFSIELFEHYYFSAKMAIMHDRTHILLNELVREPSGKITDLILNNMESTPEMSELKKKLLNILLAHSNQYGQVNLSLIDIEFKIITLIE